MAPKGGIAAEIGVWRGEFSQEILKSTRPRELHLVDPWLFVPSFPKRWYGGVQAKSQADMDAIHKSVVGRFGASPAVVVHRRKSSEAAKAFPDGYFDWVYIDGDHSYEAVLDDLADWSAKVKRGGMLTGDDYDWKDEAGDLSVKRAVDEFAARRSIENVILKNGQFILRV
jgi:hypothetical protein